MCHLILLLPVIGLVVFLVWPLVFAGPVYAIIFLLSLWMYYFFFRQMRRPVVSGLEAMRDRCGEVIAADEYGLRIRLGSEIWDASSAERLQPGDRIKVIALNGMQLTVAKVEEE